MLSRPRSKTKFKRRRSFGRATISRRGTAEPKSFATRPAKLRRLVGLVALLFGQKRDARSIWAEGVIADGRLVAHDASGLSPVDGDGVDALVFIVEALSEVCDAPPIGGPSDLAEVDLPGHEGA